jgi:histidinol-phosphate phosphatase family protein
MSKLTPNPTPCVFLDRDGTIIKDCHYLKDPNKVVFEDRAIEALQHLQKMKFALVVISNQSGIGRGLLSVDDVNKVNNRVEKVLFENGVRTLGWFICPHRPEQSCNCRKPKPGLIEQAVGAFHLDLEKSFMIGDKASDLQLAQFFGIRGYLVRTGYGHRHSDWAKGAGFPVVDNLYEAAISIQNDIHGV